MTILNRLSADQRTVLAQLMRFAVSGGLMTGFGVALYALAARILGFTPLMATVFAYSIAGCVGYVLHSQYSFRGHGERDNLARTGSRYFVTLLMSWGLNSLFVWVLTGPIRGEWWWPIPAMIFVTPLMVFIVSRRWVFR